MNKNDVRYQMYDVRPFYKLQILSKQECGTSNIVFRTFIVMWKWYAILSAFFAALTAILAKLGVKNVNSNVATAIRTLVILFITWGIVLIAGQLKQVKELTRTNILFLVLSGIATGLSWLFYFKALQLGDVSKVAPIDKLSVAIAMGLSVIFLGEQLDVKTIIGGLLIVAGTLVIIL